jgi:(p)ppGpp synthase/HD superfamily hydrolase
LHLACCMSILDKIKEFADRAHGNQHRKYTPERYIMHPVRVMKICEEYCNEETALAAALLHDVLEDTPVRAGDITVFLLPLFGREKTAKTLQLVKELTDEFTKQNYPHLNRRQRKEMERNRIAKTSPVAQTIKYADITDNCTEIVEHDPSFAAVFLRECKNLMKVMKNGNPVLYKKTLAAIESNLALLAKKKTKRTDHKV